MDNLNIAICGGGNGAHACAALMSHKGHNVRVFSPIRSEVECMKENYNKNQGLSFVIAGKTMDNTTLEAITYNAAEALSGAEVIFVIVPAFAHKTIFRYIAKHMKPDALVVVMPCRGLMELEVSRFLPNVTVMALQTLPWACRLDTPGSRIDIKGIKKKIQVACIPSTLGSIYDHLLEEFLDMRVERIKSIKTMIFSNIGQVFHPGIMYGLFKNDPNREFTEAETPLFYQGVTAEGAGILLKLVDEIQTIMQKLCEIDGNIEPQKVLSPIEWLTESYGEQIEDNSCLQKMLNSNIAYKGIRVPTIKINENTYKANFNARYIVEDVPYSLLVTRTIGHMLELATPMMDEVINGLGAWIGTDWIGSFNTARDLEMNSRLPLFYGCETIGDLLSWE